MLWVAERARRAKQELSWRTKCHRDHGSYLREMSSEEDVSLLVSHFLPSELGELEL